MNKEIHICFSEDMHPYNCDGPGDCIHCDGGVNEYHDPKTCALCRDNETEK
jgi:hypothetical protein